MAEKYSVLVKYKYLEYIDNAKLSNSDAWIFMKGIIEYDKTGKIPAFKNPVLTGLFAVLKVDLDKNREKWEEKVVRNKENGKKGGRPRKDNPENPQKPNGLSETHNNPENPQKPDLDLDLDLVFVSDNVSLNSSGFAESKTDDSPLSQKPKKPKKPPLREREPVNDMERVEKAYLQNWNALFAQGKVKTADPVINWNQTRKQLKNHFERVKPDLIIQAINKGMTDDFVLGSGYSLGIMLSAKVLNRLINTSTAATLPGLADKNTLSGLTSTF
jgi:hypothetical protein